MLLMVYSLAWSQYLSTILSLDSTPASAADPLGLTGDPTIPWPWKPLLGVSFPHDTESWRRFFTHGGSPFSGAFCAPQKGIRRRDFLDCSLSMLRGGSLSQTLLAWTQLAATSILLAHGGTARWVSVLRGLQREWCASLLHPRIASPLCLCPPFPPHPLQPQERPRWDHLALRLFFPKSPPPPSGWTSLSSLPFFLPSPCSMFITKTVQSSPLCLSSWYFKAHLWEFWQNAFLSSV